MILKVYACKAAKDSCFFCALFYKLEINLSTDQVPYGTNNYIVDSKVMY